MDEPLVSIVTPTYNMARFLPETIASVLGQDYPNIEYVVMDAASDDGTVELLKTYGDRLAWVSARDGGQADAVNRGFEQCQGQIFAFLNADDVYLPGSVARAVEGFRAHPRAGVVYGNAWYTREDGSILRPYPVQAYDRASLARRCYICQPASFVRSDVFADAGMLDASLHCALDYDLWLRIARRWPMHRIDAYLAASRMYAANKTLSRRAQVFDEVIRVTRKHCGYVSLEWLYQYAGYLLDGKDGFYEHSAASVKRYLLTLRLGLRHNPGKSPAVLRECLSQALPAARALRRDAFGGA